MSKKYRFIDMGEKKELEPKKNIYVISYKNKYKFIDVSRKSETVRPRYLDFVVKTEQVAEVKPEQVTPAKKNVNAKK